MPLEPTQTPPTHHELELHKRFRAAWESKNVPTIDDFIPADASQRVPVLVELIAIDLVCRWQQANQFETVSCAVDDSGGVTPLLPPRPHVEDYLRRYAELNSTSELILPLIVAEFRIRTEQGASPQVAEYLRRFPQHEEFLRLKLAELDAQPSSEQESPHVTIPAEDRPPTQLGRYQVLERLGAGGFGVVYRGFDPELRRAVAIKTPRADRITTSADADAYLDEARTVAALDHPGIVPVYDVGRDDGGLCYVVSKFISGGCLPTRGMLMPPERVAEIVALIAEALHYAHRQGIVHRDIKPANLMMDGTGQPLVVDFGLALKDEDYARGAELCGTPIYMSPEQARGEAHRVDARSDVYSLGVVFYELLVGKHPYRSTNTKDLLAEIIDADIRPPRQMNEAIPRRLERICLRATTRSLRDRYTTAGDFAKDLRSWLSRQGDGEVNRQRRKAIQPTPNTPQGVPLSHTPTPFDSKDRRHNLPHQSTSFVGREQEVVELKRLLAETRVLTLTGVGGGGKTRLSQRLVGEVLPEFSAGAWFVDLAPLTDASLVSQAVAQALTIRESPGQSLTETLLTVLESKELLLLLDNCEHLIDACAALTEQIVTRCPGVKILATSREGLRVTGEVAWRVPSLPVPADSGLVAAELLENPAVRLFHDRARACRSDFALTPDNSVAVAQICRRLDGIPLAIELAAARVTVLSPQQIADRLADRFHLLTRGRRDALPRQQTLEATIAWSYELLNADQGTLFSRLSVFAGDFTLEAVEAICPSADLECGLILDLVDQLAEKSLIVTAISRNGDVRYRLLESLRAFASQQLEGNAGDNGLQRRHLDYYLALTELAAPKIAAGAQAEWLTRLDADLDNIRAAVNWAQDNDALALLRLGIALRNYWEFRSLLREGRTLFRNALDRGSEAPPALRADALSVAAHLADRDADWPESHRLAQECLNVSRANDYEPGIASGLFELGTYNWRIADYEPARTFFEECLTLRRKSGKVTAIESALNNLAIIALSVGNYAAARVLLMEGLEIAREVGDLHGEHLKHYNLGICAFREGQFQEAIDHFGRALAIDQTINVKRSRGMATEMLAWSYVRMGELERASNLIAESLRLFQGINERVQIAWLNLISGYLAVELGDRQAARKSYAACLREWQKLNYRGGFPLLLEAIAHVDALDGHDVPAVRLLAASRAIRRKLNETIFPCDAPRVEELTQGLRQRMGLEQFVSNWERAEQLEITEALQIALERATIGDTSP